MVKQPKINRVDGQKMFKFLNVTKAKWKLTAKIENMGTPKKDWGIIHEFHKK